MKSSGIRNATVPNFERREVLKDPQIFRSYLHLVMSQKGDWTREKDKK
jgi:hypothetical protein